MPYVFLIIFLGIVLTSDSRIYADYDSHGFITDPRTRSDYEIVENLEGHEFACADGILYRYYRDELNAFYIAALEDLGEHSVCIENKSHTK